MTDHSTAPSLPEPKIIALPTEDGPYLHLFDEANTHQYHSGLVTLKPGESVGEHSTKEHEEIIVFLSGRGEIATERWPKPRLVTAPAVAYMSPRTLHNVTNSGTSSLRYIYIVSRI